MQHRTVSVLVALAFVATGCANIPYVGSLAANPPPPDPSTPEGAKLEKACNLCKARFPGCRATAPCSSEFQKCTFAEAMDTRGYCRL
jgi:hypothetical protein